MSSLLRDSLSSVLPAALIAVPVATILAQVVGLPWVGTCAVVGIGLALLWVGMRHREERKRERHSQLSDPCFGSIERQGTGPWWGSAALESLPGLLPISIEAGSEGPSETQRRRFLELKERFAELQEPLRASLEAQVSGARNEERSQLLSLELLAEDADAIFLTAWSVILEEGGSATFTVPLKLEEHQPSPSAA